MVEVRYCELLPEYLQGPPEGLSITTEVNVTTVDFLDVLLDLPTGSFKPFTKPNANTKYVSPQSNHPPSVICPSMQKIISAHNAKLLRPKKNQTNREKRCNCENGIAECPLNGNCLVENIVYKATVSSQLETKEYIGQTQNTFKERYSCKNEIPTYYSF